MRYSFAASGLLGLAAALPQNINIDAVLAVPTPTVLGPDAEATAPATSVYNPTAAASSAAAVVKSEGAIAKRDQVWDENVAMFIDTEVLDTGNTTMTRRHAAMKKRNACDPQPLGNGPAVSPDTAAAFSSSAQLSQIARAAATPSGYKQSFVDQSGSSQQIGYLTYRTYQTYDVQGCADACDSEKYCLGFNIYFERDPSVEPGPNCADPPSTTNIKCALYGYPVAVKAATNTGQWRQDFQVVIAGSNGYSKTNKGLPTVKDFKAPLSLPAAINAPLDNGYDTYNGMRLFNDNPFDPALCGAACEAQTEYDMAHPDSDGKYKPCNFFTTYILTRNGVPLGTYCALYTRSWDSSYATNTGYYAGDDKYEVINAGSYEITSPSTGVVPGSSSPGSNVLGNPGFESTPYGGSMAPWFGTGGGYVYHNDYKPATHSGSNYMILYYYGGQANPTPILSQSLKNLDTRKSYSLTFYWDLYGISAATTCTLSVTLGNVNIYTKTMTVSDGVGFQKWNGPATSTSVKPSSSEATLSFKYDCIARGNSGAPYSFLFLDDVSLNTI